MRRVARSRVSKPGTFRTKLVNLPLLRLKGVAVFVWGEKTLTITRAVGFSKRVGVVIKSRGESDKNVLLAISAGVSKFSAAAETAGLLEALIAEKSPPRTSVVGT